MGYHGDNGKENGNSRDHRVYSGGCIGVEAFTPRGVEAWSQTNITPTIYPMIPRVSIFFSIVPMITPKP